MSRLNFFAIVWLGCAAMIGCSENIALGSECRELGSSCPPASVLDGADAPIPPSEAGRPDAARPMDAGPPLVDAFTPPAAEASSPGDASVVLVLGNPSFERLQGEPGDITTVNAIVPGGTLIAPWYTCQPIGAGNTGLTAVRAEAMVERLDADGGVTEVVQPSEGMTMVSIAHFANVFFPLIQELEAPLASGQRYSFTLDVHALAEEPELWLQVWGADGCLPDELLAESPPVRGPTWQTVCFDFTPEEPHRLVLLQAKSSSPLGGARLLFDNLQPTTGCSPTR